MNETPERDELDVEGHHFKKQPGTEDEIQELDVEGHHFKKQP